MTRAFDHAAYDAYAFDVEDWDGASVPVGSWGQVAKQNETWTATTQPASTWATAAKQNETWAPTTAQAETWTPVRED